MHHPKTDHIPPNKTDPTCPPTYTMRNGRLVSLQTALDLDSVPLQLHDHSAPRTIRYATERDAMYIRHLNGYYSDLVGYLPRGAIETRIASHRIIIAFQERNPIGYLSFTPRNDRLLHIGQLAIEPDFWRTLCGTQCMRHVIALAKAHRCHAVTLHSRSDLPANLFWPTIGMTRGKTRPSFKSNDLTIIDWTLRLAPPSVRLNRPPYRRPSESLLRGGQ